MTIQMRPTRMQLNDRFPMLGFTIRASGDVSKYEIAIASDPALFAPRSKAQRNRNNFYSSRAQGPLPAGRDESVFVLPPEVLVRFIGQPKLYFAVAGYNGAGPAKAEIGPLPSAASPYIDLTGLSGRSLRRVRILPSRQRMEAGYGTGGAELEWAGDAASPGLQPVATEKPNGKPASGNPAPGNTAMPANPAAAAAKAAALADYTDGFGPLAPVSPPSNPTTSTPSSGHANEAHRPAHPEHIARTSPAPVQQRALATNPVTPVRHAKRPYGSAVDPRAAALSDEIPLDPGNGGMSIGPDALQIGDIILSTTDAASSGLIRFGTGSPVSHAMLYVDQGQQVIEAIGSGVAFRALADAIGPATLAVAFRAPGLDDAHRQLIADAAVAHVGEPYDNIGIIRQAKFQIDRHICDLLNGEAATTCRSFVGYVDLGTPRPGTFFCSELVLAAYAAAGAPLTTTPFNWSNPNDLVELAFRDGALAYVGHLKAPPVSSSRSIFGLGLSADALAEEETRRHKKAQALARRVGFRRAPATALATADFTWPAGLTEGNLLVTAFVEAYNQRVADGVRGGPAPDPTQYSPSTATSPDTRARDETLKRCIPRIAGELQSDTGRESVSQAILQVTTAVSIQALAEISDRLPASLYQVVLAGGPEPAQSADVVLPQGLTYVSRRIGMFMAWVDVAIQQATTDTAERLRAQKEQWDSLLAIVDGGATVLGLIPELGEAMAIIGAGIHAVLQSAAPDFAGQYASFDAAMRGVRRAYTALAATTLKELIKATLGQQNLPDLDFVHPKVQAYLDAHSAYALQGWEDELAFLGYTVGGVVRAQAASAQIAPRIVRARPLEVMAPFYAPAQTHALDLASFSVNWDDVELIPQQTGQSCWAAAGAMVVGWQDQVSLSPEKIAEIAGRTAKQGLSQDDRQAFADAIALQAEPPQSYTVDGFRQLLESFGPLWVSVRLPSSGHAIVATGIYSDGAPDGSGTYVRIADPWDRVVGSPGAPGSYLNTHHTGSRYILSWADFTREYEARASTAPDGTVNVQILHASGTAGRTPNLLSPPAGYAMTAATADLMLPPPPRAKVRARQMDAGAAEIAPIVSGVTMTRVTGGDANVSWELDQLEGLKYPNDQAVSPLPPLQDAPPIHLIGWPYVKAPSGDQISADLTLDWQYTGTALGNIRIAATGSHGVPPQTLKVKAHIINDTILHPKEAPHMAGLRVRVHYQFSRTAGSDAVGVTHLHLFGDGTYDQTSRWEQS